MFFEHISLAFEEADLAELKELLERFTSARSAKLSTGLSLRVFAVMYVVHLCMNRFFREIF